MEKYFYFPSCVYREEKPEWLNTLRSVFNKYYNDLEKNNELLVSQTSSMVGDETLSFFENYLKHMAFITLQEQGYSVAEYTFYLSSIWGALISPLGNHMTHIHRESSLCGFYFLDTPKDGAYPVFEDPRPAKFALELDSIHRQEITLATPSIHFNNIKPGTILISNSWLPHRFEPNRGKGITKFVHFLVSQNKRNI